MGLSFSPRQSLTTVLLGAAGGRILFVADPEYPLQPVASRLEQWAIKELKVRNPKLQWNRSDEGLVLKMTWGQGQWGRRSAATEVSLTRLLELMNVPKTPSQGVLILGKHYQTNVVRSPDAESRTSNYFRIDSNLNDPISVRLSLESTTIWLAALFVAFVPIVAVVAFAIAIRVGKDNRIELSKRRRLYSKIIMYSVFGSIALHAPFAFWMIMGPGLRSIGELWFGTTRVAGIAVPFLLGPVALLFLALPLLTKVERKLFGAPSPQTPAPSVDPRISAIYSKEMKRTLLFLPISLAIFALFVFVPALSRFQFLGFLLAFVMPHLLPALTRSKLKREILEVVGNEADVKVKAIADGVSLQMGQEFKGIEVDHSPLGSQSINAAALPGSQLKVSRRAALELSEDELRFLIAHELAHIKMGHARRKFLILGLPVLVVLTVPIFLMLTRTINVATQGTFALGILFFGMVGTFIHIFTTGRMLVRKYEYEADIAALTVTRNLPAAVSLLEKLAMTSPMPGSAEIETGSTHPAISKRIQAVQQAAIALHL